MLSVAFGQAVVALAHVQRAGASGRARPLYKHRCATIDVACAVERKMNHKVRIALLTAIVLGAPGLASAQEQLNPTGSDNVAITQLDRETQLLATMRQQIPQDTISAIPIDGLDRAQRRMLLRQLVPQRAAALQHALSEATVATEDRPDGISEDQVTLADYLISLGIDPSHVVSINIATNVDRENPPVTVFYRSRQTAS